MKHLHHLLAQPSPQGLSDVMRTQQRLVDEVLFRTIELTALVEAGQHRFIGRALDDLDHAERELGQAELVRAAMTEALLESDQGVEPTLSDLLASVDHATADSISTTASQIRSGLTRLEGVKRGAAPTARERVSRAKTALGAATSGPGLYSRA